MENANLLVFDSKTLKGSTINSLTSKINFSLDSSTLLTGISSSSTVPLENSSVNQIVSLAETPGLHSVELLSEFNRVLKSGGTLVIQEPVANRPIAEVEAVKLGQSSFGLRNAEELTKSLLYAGFKDMSSSTIFEEIGLSPNWSGLTPVSVGSTVGPLLQPQAFKAQKPSWEAGKSFSLKIKGDSSAKVTGSKVTLSLDEVDTEIVKTVPLTRPSWLAQSGPLDEDLVDEDSLLTEADLAAPTTAVDCGDVKSAKKACQNCTCGRAEMEQKQEASKKLTVDQVSNPQSACGSCGLGDAFRCAGCPYRGLPAFKLGEKISLSSDLLKADV